jgi:LysR family transcriptional regulator, hydrogen peroxide-inducible genes activator
MNMQQLRYARALAELGSFVRAADHCAVTQPTLSNAIAQLELELGHKLFHRTTRSVSLTQAGAHLLADIRDVLQAQEALVARAKALSNPERRLIRVGVSPLLGVKLVDMVITPFRAANPDVEIVFRELNLAEMVRLLDIGQIEFVFGPSDPVVESRTGYDTALFLEEPLVFVPGRRSKEIYARGQSASLQQIASETFVMVPDACGLTKTTRALFTRQGLTLNEYAGQAMSYAVLQEWADLGIGSAILPRSKLQEGTAAVILMAAETGLPLQIRHHCLWRQGEGMPSEVMRFATFLRDVAPSVIRGLSP